MPKHDDFQRQLAALNALDDPAGAAALPLLRQALAGRSNLLAARAAEIAGEWALEALRDDLAHAFARFLPDATRRDPTCAAKHAIAEALVRLEHRDETLFLTGLRFVQLEPVYGGREDTAARLRAICAAGLVGMDYPGVLLELAALLADPEADARVGAVRAIARATEPGGLPLLWYKLLIGDEATDVLYECFAAVLLLEPARAAPHVAGYVRRANPSIAEAAALALGESRLPEALPLLRAAWEESDEPAVRRVILLALAVLRRDEATDFLLGVLANGTAHEAHDALAALELYRRDDVVWSKVEKRLTERGLTLPSPSGRGLGRGSPSPRPMGEGQGEGLKGKLP